MTRFTALAGAMLLAGCSAQQSADIVGAAQKACGAASPVLAAAALVPEPRVQAILGFAEAMCRPLAAGAVPATLDGNTASWVAGLVQQLRPLVGR
jgi:hypothetical protein